MIPKMNGTEANKNDTAPGDEGEHNSLTKGISGYVIGLVLALGLTAASFWLIKNHLIYGPGIPMAIITLAIAQMGIHLVFFLHLSTGPDNINNVMALAFGILIVCLVIFGSMWIMGHLNHNMMPMDKLMQMQH